MAVVLALRPAGKHFVREGNDWRCAAPSASFICRVARSGLRPPPPPTPFDSLEEVVHTGPRPESAPEIPLIPKSGTGSRTRDLRLGSRRSTTHRLVRAAQ